YYKKTQYVAAGTIAAMIVNVILNYICILNFGYMAAAYTTAFSYLLLLVVQGFLEYKVTGMVITPIHKTVLIALFYGAVNVLSMRLFTVPWYLRYMVFLLVTAGAAIVMWPKVKGILGTFRKK
ncbi:MAG: polysaccharide biosynthesis protein, partial [Eubacterium sp.]|nr:polysaccharide biosynthesis protein [Eubacterium sp.]